ncbi:MAG: PaaI family thioesterase [Rhodospirillaceae bacterium]|nr:PaaI family thioesterase [Rhodospirillaceae bacterium]
MSSTVHNITKDTIGPVSDLMFAPWVKELKLEWLEVEKGRVLARLRRQPKLCHFSPGRPDFADSSSMSGQVLMAAIDTVFSMAIATGDAVSRGTISQNNNFVSAANTESLLLEAKVQRFGKAIAIGETIVTDEASGRLVCHATSTFAMNPPEKAK